jgi:hypothetical protein
MARTGPSRKPCVPCSPTARTWKKRPSQ